VRKIGSVCSARTKFLVQLKIIEHAYLGEDNMAALTNDQILDAIASMTVLEASELVKAMEEKFGVTAAVAVAAGPAAAAGGAAEEQTEFTVTLDSFDAAKKIPVIKVVRETTGLGLGEAKALVEGAPKVLKEGVSKADADEIAKKIEEAGGKVSKK
jgi:large subunit ribosomal protein L7/L12